MYSMCAERITAEDGTALLWHALDRNGELLCTRPVGGAAEWTQDAVNDRDEYCGDCMDAVAMAFRPVPRATDAHGAEARAFDARTAGGRAAVGGGTLERHAPADPESRPHGR
ncbi:hypothetical protein ACISU4_20330 [Streptomyces wuyuanensis]|uniref:hypothetical protein n=1 Tax=Streptomyces wuyuanensis TaxID=1196353 RepID=UPI0037F7E48F